MKEPIELETAPALTRVRFWQTPPARALGRLLALLLVFSFFLVAVPKWNFIERRTLEDILVQSTVVGTAAIGATMVIISGGIDLSVGSLIFLSVIVTSKFVKLGAGYLHGTEAAVVLWPLLAVTLGLALTTLAGLVNGVLITGLRIVPFIVTLGMMQVLRGLGKGIAKGGTVYTPSNWIGTLMDPVYGTGRSWMLLPAGVWIMILSALAAAVFLRYTRLGRYIFAVGSNELTARLCGVRITRTKVVVYALAGLFAALAGIMQYSFNKVGDIDAASGYELFVIAAVVIGGGSLRGGEGSIFGSIIGAIIMAVLWQGCVKMGWPRWVQEIVTGGIIITAVAIDQLRHRRMT